MNVMRDAHQHDQIIRQCSYELSTLNEIARTLNASVDLPTLLDQALKKVVHLLDLQTGWILLFDEQTGQPYTAATLNLRAGSRSQLERMNGWCYCLEKFKSGNLTEAANIGVVKCSRLHALSLSRGDTADLHYHASIPLIAHEENHDNAALRLGMLNVATSQWRGLTDTIRILIVDDHPVVRDGLAAMLTTQTDMEIVGEAGSGAEGITKAQHLRPDIVLMDLEMPGIDGVETIKKLMEMNNALLVVVLTAFDTDDRMIGAIEAGAQGYLSKGAPREEIFNAIQVVYDGGAINRTEAVRIAQERGILVS
jgi:CheY-like chemotaxis protein